MDCLAHDLKDVGSWIFRLTASVNYILRFLFIFVITRPARTSKKAADQGSVKLEIDADLIHQSAARDTTISTAAPSRSAASGRALPEDHVQSRVLSGDSMLPGAWPLFMGSMA